MSERPEAPEPDDEDPSRNDDDGAAGTLEQPRTEDEGGDEVEDTIPDA